MGREVGGESGVRNRSRVKMRIKIEREYEDTECCRGAGDTERVIGIQVDWKSRGKMRVLDEKRQRRIKRMISKSKMEGVTHG